MNEIYKELMPYLEKGMAYQTALTLLEWDQETLAPVQAEEYTSNIVGELSDSYMQILVNEDVKKKLEKLLREREWETLSEKEQANITEWKKLFEQLEAIPQKEYKTYSTLVVRAGNIWSKAKEKNDFACFAPTLFLINKSLQTIEGKTKKRIKRKSDMIYYWTIMSLVLTWKYWTHFLKN